jgi:glycosyltransferase involved in cell wall biosynthesis
MSALTIFILCHNRPDFTRQTLHSILAQTDRDFELVVSDNSSNDEVQHMLSAEFQDVDYRRRIPMLPPLAHFNACIGEVQSEYFCLFHDDDLMHADYVQNMKQVLNSHQEIAACGCNALLETHGKLEKKKSFMSLGKLEQVCSARSLARRYISRAQNGIAPFPGYVYRSKFVGEIRLPVDGGKYSDVTWLLELAKKAPLVWIAAPLMTYRIHGGNDGGVESTRDRLRFLGFLKRNADVLGEDLLADYRGSFIYKPMLKIERDATLRTRVVRGFLRNYSWQRYLNPDLYSSLLKRQLIKWVSK